jgi:hypothetical protein
VARLDHLGADPMTECVCEACGVCPRHRRPTDPAEGRIMADHEWRLCRTVPGMFAGFQADVMRADGRLVEPPEDAAPGEPFRFLTPADLPCRHRGEYIETIACKPCQSSGREGAEVYRCERFGRCMMHNFATLDAEEAATACATCDDREPG